MSENISTKAMIPSYHAKRIFLGKKDLVVSFYTEKCPFTCSFCAVHSLSSNSPVSSQNIMTQIDWIFDHYKDELSTFEQLSAGNNGSILDAKRFSIDAFQYLVEKSRELTNLQVLSLETRPEYLQQQRLVEIIRGTHANVVDVAIGFESQDDKLRNEILRKHIRREAFERKINLLGKLGVRLTAFVMLKPGPTMTEEEGVREAVSTIRYLAERCSWANTDLVVYLNPTYVARDSPLAKTMRSAGYKPPKIQSVVETILRTKDLGVPIYVGLWNEGLAKEGGDYTARADYDPGIRDVVKEFNKTGDFSVLEGCEGSRDVLT